MVQKLWVISFIVKIRNPDLQSKTRWLMSRLGYQSGIDRYYGLLEFGEKHGVFQRSGNRYDMNGTQLYGKSIYADPEKYFTEDVMKKLDEAD